MAYKEKRGKTWRIKVSCGFNGNGKRIQKSTTWTPSPKMTPEQEEKELERQIILFEEKCRKEDLVNENMYFKDFIQRWLDKHVNSAVDGGLRDSTSGNYEDMLPRIITALGNRKLKDIKPRHINEFYENLTESGIRLDTKYYPTEQVKVLINAQGMSKLAFAKKAGVSEYVVKSCTMEERRNVNKKSAELISKALGKRMNDLFETRGKDVLSKGTRLKYHRVVSSILSFAVKDEAITENPAHRAKFPKMDEEDLEAHFLDEFEAIQLFDALEDEPYIYNIKIKTLTFSGMRRGELFGLWQEDVDYLNNVIWVKRSLLYIKRKGVQEDKTKNYKSARDVDIPPELTSLLKEYKIWFDNEKVASITRHEEYISKQKQIISEQNEIILKQRDIISAKPPNSVDYKNTVAKCDKIIAFKERNIAKCEKRIAVREQVITNIIESKYLFLNFKTGKPYNPDTLTKYFRKLIKRKNLPDACVHSLRHTNATLMIMEGVPAKAVADNLGWASTAMMDKVYVHSIKSKKKEAAQAVQDRLARGRNKLS